MKKSILFLSIFMLTSLLAQAQEETTKALTWSAKHGMEYSVKAGLNIGGTSPLPIPEEIRSIEGYTPALSFSIEGNVTKWISDKWGIETGIRLESKGMRTKARVKNYSTEMIDNDGGYMKGMWTGYVKTKINNSYITIPVLATYKLATRWKLQGGLFASYMFDGTFSGNTYDGYLRDGDPTGTKVYVDRANYDFSNQLSKFQWGAQLGAEWKAFKHLSVNANLTWGFVDILKKNFDTITFAMYPIYLNLGFGYSF